MLLGGAAGMWPLSAGAQQSERIRRIGVLIPRTAEDPEYQERMTAFLEGLQQLCWHDGRNVRAAASGGDDRRHSACADHRRDWARIPLAQRLRHG